MKKVCNVLTGILFALCLLAGGIALLFVRGTGYSDAERRPLAEAPEWSGEDILSGRTFRQTDLWATDNFPFRDEFRSVKAFWQLNMMRETESNGLTVADGSIVKLEKKVNQASVDYASQCFRAIYEKYLKDSGCRTYTALIPDKSYFLGEKGIPVMDLKQMESSFSSSVPGAKCISLRDHLTLEDYYRTDSHWRQEKILPAANALLTAMGKEGDLSAGMFETEVYEPFYGVYAGQSALNPEPDRITYLTGGPISGLKALDPVLQTEVLVYDPDGCDARDPYTLFLGGSKGVVIVSNPSAPEGTELIVFRDSFGASMAPLLCAKYRKTTLIDIRYVHPSILRRFVSFGSQDVLFLYSATLLNNSQALNLME